MKLGSLSLTLAVALLLATTSERCRLSSLSLSVAEDTLVQVLRFKDEPEEAYANKIARDRGVLVPADMRQHVFEKAIEESVRNAQENFPLEKVSVENVPSPEFRWLEVDKKILDLLDANGAFEFDSLGFRAAAQGL